MASSGSTGLFGQKKDEETTGKSGGLFSQPPPIPKDSKATSLFSGSGTSLFGTGPTS